MNLTCRTTHNSGSARPRLFACVGLIRLPRSSKRRPVRMAAEPLSGMCQATELRRVSPARSAHARRDAIPIGNLADIEPVLEEMSERSGLRSCGHRDGHAWGLLLGHHRDSTHFCRRRCPQRADPSGGGSHSEPVSVTNRTCLRRAEMEIGKLRAETGAQNPPRTDRNIGNCWPETGACQPNPRKCRRFSPRRRITPRRPDSVAANRIRTKACTCIICIAFNRRKTRAKSRRAR
jgi:hypothetical protein